MKKAFTRIAALVLLGLSLTSHAVAGPSGGGNDVIYKSAEPFWWYFATWVQYWI